MSDLISAGDGAPPAPPPAGPAPAIPTEGNASVLEYARRKARQRESTEPKAAKAQPKGAAQKQPGASAAEPVPVLSQSAATEAQNTEAAQTPSEPSAAAPEPEPEPTAELSQEEPTGEGQEEATVPEDAPEWVQKRIARFTRQKGELERKLQATEAEKQQLQGEVERYKANPTPEAPFPVVIKESDPASGITDERQLEHAIEQARYARDWSEENPDGGTVQIPDGKGGYNLREISAEQAQAMRKAARADLEVHLPRRRDYLRSEQTATAGALREFPWLADKASPLFAKFKQAVAQYPQIRLRPDWARSMAFFVEGIEAVEARVKAAAQPAAVPKIRPQNPPPRVLGSSPSAPARTGTAGAAKAQLEAAEKEWKDAPSQQTFARLQQARRQQRSEL